MPARAIRYEPRSLLERLLILYREQDAHRAYADILDLVEKYRTRVPSEPYRISERDAILITYGDQVVCPQEPSLATLARFLSRYVGDSISAVHVLPFYPASSDGGFSVIDYKEVSPKLGTWENIAELSGSYRLMFDAVINHASQYSFWFKGFLRGMPEFADFFIEVDPATDLSGVVRARTSPLVSTFEDEESRIRRIWTTFGKDQVDLNYSNYRVLLAVLDTLLFYVWKGAKLLRLDAIAFVWKKIGTRCVHLPETHELVQLIREVIHEVAPEVIIITETNVPHDENVSYFGHGDDEAQMVYNFALPPLLALSILEGDATTLTRWANTLELPSDQVCFFNFGASHDGIGLRAASGLLGPAEVDRLIEAAVRQGGLVSYQSLSDGTQAPYEINCSYMDLLAPPEAGDALRIARMLASLAVVLAMPGVPGIYFHSLVGSRNNLLGVQATGEYRSINRERFNFDRLAAELETPGSLRNAIFTRCRDLLQIRTRERAFNPFGPYSFPDLHPAVFAIDQIAPEGDERVLALHNLSGQPVTVPLPEAYRGPSVDLATGRTLRGATHLLAPCQFSWIKVA